MAVTLRGMEPLLLVEDIDVSIGFYRDVLGFEVVSASGPEYAPGWALLARDGIELMLNGAHARSERTARKVPDTVRVAAHGDTCLYFGCPDLDGARAHFVHHGLDVPEPAMTGYGFRSLHLRDPDGYSIILHWPVTEAARLDWEARYGPQSLRPPA